MTKSLNNSEIRPENLVKIGTKLLKNDLRNLKKRYMIKVDCPACGLRKYDFLFKKNQFDFVSCRNCLTVFINPRPTQQMLEQFYTTSKYIEFWNEIFNKTQHIRKEKIFKPRVELVSKILEKNKIKNVNKLIEVGSGHGWFCELAKKQQLAKNIIAIEPSPLFAARCRDINGIKVIESTIENYLQQNDRKLDSDIIVNFELIAHLFDPRLFLESCYKGLKKGGLFICSTPNFHGFDIQILKKKSEYVSPHFLNYFNPNSITILLSSIGFKNIDVITPGLMDIHIIINKIKSGELMAQKYPFIDFIMNNGNENFINEFQGLLQKYKMSSHMVVSAKK